MTRYSAVALAGGIGAARFLDGLTRVIPPASIFVIGNTGDDTEMHGLHVSPDLDTVTYTLAGLSDTRRGWGVRNETFHCLDALAKLGAETWFQLGDRDLAVHIYRTQRLEQGAQLAEVTAEITKALKVPATLAPMSNHRVRTKVATASGEMDFQTYFVKRRARDTVVGLRFEGASDSTPAPGVIDAIEKARAIILCPSNPFISIAPILSVPGIREALRPRRERVIGISPIVAGRALKGPAAKMMKNMGIHPSPSGVAKLYSDFVGVFVIDALDWEDAARIDMLGMRTVVTDTIMSSPAKKKALARVVAREMGILK